MGLEPPAPSWGLSPPPALVWLTKASPAGAVSCGTIAWPPACSLPQGRTKISGRETHTDPAGVAAQPCCTPRGWERFVGRANIPAVPQLLHQGHARGCLRQPSAPQIPNPPLRAQKASSAQKQGLSNYSENNYSWAGQLLSPELGSWWGRDPGAPRLLLGRALGKQLGEDQGIP